MMAENCSIYDGNGGNDHDTEDPRYNDRGCYQKEFAVKSNFAVIKKLDMDQSTA